MKEYWIFMAFLVAAILLLGWLIAPLWRLL